MQIKVINPNTTESMTQTIAAAASMAAKFRDGDHRRDVVIRPRLNRGPL